MPDLFDGGDKQRRERLFQLGWSQKWNCWEAPWGALLTEAQAFAWLEKTERDEREAKQE